VTEAIRKSDLFLRLGYAGPYDGLERVLEEAGLSRATRTSISAAKAPEVERLLAERFVPVCGRGDCRTLAADGTRGVVTAASPAQCEICRGSSNARAVDAMVQALRAAGCRALCVVGGSPASWTALRDLVGGRVELHLVDGTTSRSGAQAQADMARADLTVVWGATFLDHKISLLYQNESVILIARRSIRDLAAEVVAAVGEGGAGRRRVRI